jgi:hypothetical protein
VQRSPRRYRIGNSGWPRARAAPGRAHSAPLDHLSARAIGCPVARASSVQAERQLALAGLQRLCAPFLDRLSRLPDPQPEALGVAVGPTRRRRSEPLPRRPGRARPAVGGGRRAAAVCVIGDAQWLDRASARTLAFAARQLVAKSVALVFALLIRRYVEFDDLGGCDGAAACRHVRSNRGTRSAPLGGTRARFGRRTVGHACWRPPPTARSATDAAPDSHQLVQQLPCSSALMLTRRFASRAASARSRRRRSLRLGSSRSARRSVQARRSAVRRWRR